MTGVVWVDAEGDGKISYPSDHAERMIEEAEGDLKELLNSLNRFDKPTAAHAAMRLMKAGVDVAPADLRSAPNHVQKGFREYWAGINDPAR